MTVSMASWLSEMIDLVINDSVTTTENYQETTDLLWNRWKFWNSISNLESSILIPTSEL